MENGPIAVEHYFFSINEKVSKRMSFYYAYSPPPKCPCIITIISLIINHTDLIFVPFDLALNSASNGVFIFVVIAIPDLVEFCRAIKNRPFTCATFRERLLKLYEKKPKTTLGSKYKFGLTRDNPVVCGYCLND